MHSEYFGIANHKLTLGVRCGQEKRPGLAAEKKSLGEIAKELSAMWGVDAKEIDHWPSSQTSQTGSNHCWMDGWMDTWSCIHAQRCCRCCFDFWHLGDEANALKRRNSLMKRKPEKARTVREDVGCGENSHGRESMVTLIYCSQYSSEASDAFRYIFRDTITTNQHFTTHFRNNPLSHCRKSCMNVFFSH